MTYSATVLADTPFVYYRFNDASGTSCTDSSGNSNTGTYSSSGITYSQAGAITGDSDNAIDLDGSNGYVSLPIGIDISTFTAMTVEVWVKFNSATAHSGRVVSTEHTDSNKKGFQLALNSANSGGGLFDVGNGTTEYNIYYGTNVASGWHHFVGIWNGSNIQLYLDAQKIGQSTTTGSIAASTFAMTIGKLASASSDFCPIFLDEFALYKNSALTQARISAHYLAGAGIRLVSQGNAKYSIRTNLRTGAVGKFISRVFLSSSSRSKFTSRAALSSISRSKYLIRAILSTRTQSKFYTRILLKGQSRSKFLIRAILSTSSRSKFLTRITLSTMGRSKFLTRVTLSTRGVAKFFSRFSLRAVSRANFRIRSLFSTSGRVRFFTHQAPRKPLRVTFKPINKLTVKIGLLTLANPNSLLVVSATVVDNLNNLQSSVQTIAVSVTFPDGSISNYAMSSGDVINNGLGTYQLTYTSKGPGYNRETWTFTNVDGAIVTCQSLTYVSY